jgi:precorrin-2 dehydrogenase/sirohydrochlorin ferrochelatase
MNSYYPLFIKMEGVDVLVIGGGKVAERKVRSLLKAGARVLLVSPIVTSGLRRLIDGGRITWRERVFQPSDLDGVRLAFCATDDAGMHSLAVKEGKQRGVLMNVVDVPELCEFIVPSVVQRGDLTVAVSTGGSSPALAKKIRKEMDAHFGPEYREFLKLLKQVRPIVQGALRDVQRRRLFRELADSEVLDLLRKGHKRAARVEIATILKRYGVKGWKA